MSTLAKEYKASIAPALMQKFGYKSVMQIPKLDKVVINVGAGEAKDNAKVIDAIITDLGKITGQKAIPCKAKKSVADKRQFPAKLRSLLQTSSSVKECPSVQRLLSEARECMNLLRDFSTQLSPEYVTSEVLTPTLLMAEETMLWALRNS